MKSVIETERLVLRCFNENDAGLVFQLNQDELVTRFTYDRISTLEQANAVLHQSILPHYTQHGFGRWAVTLKPAGIFVGYCGLKYRPALDEVDLGYRFLPAWWGRGLAVEAAKASLDVGFNQLGLTRITARAVPGNQASIAVLQKCGFTLCGDDLVDGMPVVVFEIRKTT